MDLYKFVNPEIIFGRNALLQVGDSLVRLGAKKVFVVSDPGVIEAGWVDKVIPSIKKAGLEYEVWHEITSNPKDVEVHKGLDKYLESGANAVLGVGGGSPMDAAKAVAILSTNQGRINDFEGTDKIQYPLPPMVTVPTTAGTGAEVTQFAIITDTSRKVKMAICSKSLIPDIALVDPITLTTKDSKLTAYTGMDALTHAIESYVSLAATPLTDIHALNSIKLIAQHLPTSVSNRSNLKAKEAMAMASLQAGLALSNAILGLVHAMSHQLGGLLDMPHGEANSILLPYVMEFNLTSVIDKYIDIAKAMGKRIEGLERREAAQKAVEAVYELSKDVNIPAKLSDIGFDGKNLAHLSENAMKDICLVTNPRDVEVEDIISLYESAF